jgi:hypothetical protein
MLDPSEVEQGSAAWHACRLGKATASRMGDIMARVKPSKDNLNGYSKRREKYMRELLVERLTGVDQAHFVSSAMEYGAEMEDMAAAAYEAKNSVVADTCGFFDHPTIPNSGASPDRLVPVHGLLEIKDPTTSTHLDTIILGTYDEDYRYQMAWEYECVPAAYWVDFVSYDPRLPINAGYFQERYLPWPSLLCEMRAEVIKFLAELDELEARVRAYKGA